MGVIETIIQKKLLSKPTNAIPPNMTLQTSTFIVMPLGYGGLETHKNTSGLGQRELEQKGYLYCKKEIQDSNSPNVGTNQKIMRGYRVFKITMRESRTQI